MGQDTNPLLPYESIPDYPDAFNAVTVAARMIDGLGYRYFWATEGLRDEDLHYKASETSRSTFETLKHIHGLSKTIYNGTIAAPNIRSGDQGELSFLMLREETLKTLFKASEKLKASHSSEMENMKIIFQRGDQSSEFPFWNMINGPIADALWHAGQVVAFRRASGNPINPNVSVFSGKNRK